MSLVLEEQKVVMHFSKQACLELNNLQNKQTKQTKTQSNKKQNKQPPNKAKQNCLDC